jgi:hypothetical protein
MNSKTKNITLGTVTRGFFLSPFCSFCISKIWQIFQIIQIVVQFTLEKHICPKHSQLFCPKKRQHLSKKSHGPSSRAQKSVESKARAYFWQTDVKFGRK